MAAVKRAARYRVLVGMNLRVGDHHVRREPGSELTRDELRAVGDDALRAFIAQGVLKAIGAGKE